MQELYTSTAKAREGSMARCAAETHTKSEPLRKRMEKVMLWIKYIAACGACQLPHQWMGAGYIAVYKFLPFLHHLNSFLQAADAGTTNMQKPFRRRNNADLIPRLRAWTELKKQSVQHSSMWDSSGDGIRPQALPAPLGVTRPWWLLYPSSGGRHGEGSCSAVCSRFGEIQAQSFPARILCWKCSEVLPTTLLTETQQRGEWLHRTGTHLVWEIQNQHPTAPAGKLSSTWGSPEKTAEVSSGPWQSSDPWQSPPNLEKAQLMSLHGITIHIGGSCLQVSPLGPGFSRKRCHRPLSLCSEGFSSPPVAPLPVRERERGQVWWCCKSCGWESTPCHPSGCSELAAWMHCLWGGEMLCSWEGKKGQTSKTKSHWTWTG